MTETVANYVGDILIASANLIAERVSLEEYLLMVKGCLKELKIESERLENLQAK